MAELKCKRFLATENEQRQILTVCTFVCFETVMSMTVFVVYINNMASPVKFSGWEGISWQDKLPINKEQAGRLKEILELKLAFIPVLLSIRTCVGYITPDK